MLLAIDANHPRMFINGKPHLIPVCHNIGALSDMKNKDKVYLMDSLGMGVSMYFKLLKALIRFYIFVIICSLPIFYLYYQGEYRNSSSSSKFIGFTLGNLGGGNTICSEGNIRLYDKVELKCYENQLLSTFKKMGIQKPNP